jgi:hypothetical protein
MHSWQYDIVWPHVRMRGTRALSASLVYTSKHIRHSFVPIPSPQPATEPEPEPEPTAASRAVKTRLARAAASSTLCVATDDFCSRFCSILGLRSMSSSPSRPRLSRAVRTVDALSIGRPIVTTHSRTCAGDHSDIANDPSGSGSCSSSSLSQTVLCWQQLAHLPERPAARPRAASPPRLPRQALMQPASACHILICWERPIATPAAVTCVCSFQ